MTFMEDEKLEPEHDHEHAEPFTDGSDVCQQLMDRYAKSTAAQHRHLLATAAAMRSLLAAESLPLTPPAYFAAAITAIDDAASSASQTLDPTAVAALLAFLAIVLPIVPPRGIEAEKASEAVQVLVRLLGREKEGLAVSSVRAVVKCLGVLVGLCNLQDWGCVKLGFETLLKFSVDRRPKVRRCSQECLEKVFKSIHSSAVTKEASKLVFSMLKMYMPLAVELSTLGATVGPKNVEVLHMLNLLKLIVPFLSMKTRSKVIWELEKLMKCQFTALTRHILKTIETCFDTARVDVISPSAENIVVSLSSYISLGEKNPVDTVKSATTLLQRSLDILCAGESTSYIKSLSLVCDSVAGLLTSEDSIASHAALILKEVISHHVNQISPLVDDSEPFQVDGKESNAASAIKSTCAILENSLMTCDGKPNEHILTVISALFLKLGGFSAYYMKNILLKLADLMTLASGGKFNTIHLQSCIGSAVIAMGPERILADVHISLNAGDFTSSNIWLVPILKKYVVGASLEYYMEHVMPLAKSFQRASRKATETTIGQSLESRAHDLWGLLPSFCQYPTDFCQNIGPLAEVLIKFLKKDSFMHENVAVSLQVLVNQNKSTLNQKTDAGVSKSSAVLESVSEFSSRPTYSKKIATKNLKALASYSNKLLRALTDLFIDSPPTKRSFFKDAIGCLASITDPSVTKKIFMSLLEQFEFIDDMGEFGKPENAHSLVDKEQGNLSIMEKDAQRCVILELASCLVEGANEDLIDLIYNFIKCGFQVTDEIGHRHAYQTLSRILREHARFCSSRFIELTDLLLGFKSPTDIAALRSRFACFHPLMVHILKIDSEEENAKAFVIVNEIILTLKDAKEEEVRKAAYDVLLEISSSLRDTSSFNCESSDAPYQKLINMVMGYLSGASPHIKSGAVSVLSVLIYKDTDIYRSMPDLIPSLLCLLQGKSVEVIKAVLGFVKVLVSCIEARDLQHLLPDVLKEVLPWSSVSRNHFRAKVTVIMEIMIRKCGFSAVESVAPETYRRFLKSVLENRQTKTNPKDAANPVTDKETRRSTKRQEKRKHNELDTEPGKIQPVKHRKRMEKKQITDSTGTNEKSVKGQFERSRKLHKGKFDKGPPSGQKRKTNMGKKEVAFKKPGPSSMLNKRKKFGRRGDRRQL
ncbi:Coatomer beta subunit [Parasponia andersonii]|uniref:Coatomer beta subunit n=1 Tax=Parasponia andersonii TaxID=3476 RepID=A0A2P5A4Q1_PARAD|nr:Coatomer beta subunit [Parasponia andersonii]